MVGKAKQKKSNHPRNQHARSIFCCRYLAISWTNPAAAEVNIDLLPENIVAGPLSNSVDVLAPDAHLKAHAKVGTGLHWTLVSGPHHHHHT